MKELNTLLGLLFAILVMSILIAFNYGQIYYDVGGKSVNVESNSTYTNSSGS